MDSFMDKIAQKFTAQDMIKANSAAEEKEMKRLRMQVAEYDERLQEMRKLNLKNLELADQLQTLISEGQEKVQAIQVSADNDGQEEWKALQQSMQTIKEALDAQNSRMTELSEQIMDHVHKEDVKVYRNVPAVLMEQLSAKTRDIGDRLDKIEKQLDKNNNKQSVLQSLKSFIQNIINFLVNKKSNTENLEKYQL